MGVVVPIDLEALRADAFHVGAGQVAIREPVVKDLLETFGARAPRRAVCHGASDVPGAAQALSAPLVLKAWGPGIVHKTELGAVVVGLAHDALAGAADRMAQDLAARGIRPAGFLVEEQARAGAELLVGVVHRRPFGHLAVIGLGGTLAEVLDDVATRLCPLTAADAEAMATGFRGAAVLQGWRGGAPLDVDAVVELLLAVAGPDGLAARLGDTLAEFECNPVIVGERGALVADARLVLGDAPLALAGPERPPLGDTLFAPRSLAVMGASTTRTTVANRALRRYRSLGWDGYLYAVHPSATEIEGVPAFPSVADIPGGVDYLNVMLPARSCPDAIRGAKGHAKVAHVLSSGFGEAGDEGRDLEDDLRAAALDAGIRVLGPNSLGVYSPRGRQAFAARSPREPGNVGAVFQSGGLTGDLIHMAGADGVRFSKVVSSGNGTDVGVGELTHHLVDDDETAVVAVHVEGGADEALIDALRRAQGRKPVVLLATGLSQVGSRAAASHTGSMASDRRSWAAVAASTGIVLVERLDDLLAVLRYVVPFVDAARTSDRTTLIVGVGGGASVMAADAVDPHGLDLAPLAANVVDRLRGLGFGDGTSVANPMDIPIFQGSSVDTMRSVLDATLSSQQFADVLLHVDVATYYHLGDYSAELPGITHLVRSIEALGERAPNATRVAFVARNLGVAPGADIDAVKDACRAARLPLFSTLDDAALAIGAAQRLLPTDDRRVNGHF